MSIEKQPCIECGAEILATTAAKTDGKCIPCDRGTRAQIEEGKKWEAERRRLEKVNEEDPLGVLWPIVVDTVFSGPNRAENVEALAPEAQVIYLVQMLDGEVINGGFHQYFSNSAGNHAHQAQRALLEVGAVEASRILGSAIGAFPDARVPNDRVARNEQLDVAHAQRPGFFDGLDTEYYALTDTDPVKEDLAELMLSFMQRHVDAPVAAA